MYARYACTVGDTDSWLHDPMLHDVPRSGECFQSGQPVCSVRATAPDSQACYRALVGRAERVYEDLERATLLAPALQPLSKITR